MSIINAQLEEGLAPWAVCAGSTVAVALLGAVNHIGGACAGVGAATASLSLGTGGEVALAGSTAGAATSTARLRLNSEVNIELAATSPSSTGAACALGLRSRIAGRSDGASTAAASLSFAQAEEFGFTIFLDIVGSGVQPGTAARYRARIIADGEYDEEGTYVSGGTEVPVSSFDLNAPEGALGVGLSVTLASPDVSLVANASTVQFDLGVWTGAAYEWVTMLAGGKLAGRSLSIAYGRGGPADTVTLQLVDVVADRWTLAPDAPETLYDPDHVDEPQPPDSRSQVIDEQGGRIEPVTTAVYGLGLREVLRRAYVEGCGFDDVVTNIPDFSVSEVTFSLEGGYHEAVRPLLSLFEPVYFAEANVLWIVDAGAPLPAGLAPRELPLSAVVSVTDTAPSRTPLASLIVAYRSDSRAGGDYYTERVEQESQETGTFGAKGYTRADIERRVREYRNFDAPETVVREEVASVEVTTTDYEFTVVGRETKTDSFDSLGRKSGHTRSVEALVPDLEGGGALTLQTVSEETYTVLYRAGRVAGSDEIATTVTETSGLVLIDEDRTYLDRPFEIALTDAHQSGYVDPEAGQSAEFRAIRTVTESYVREGASTEVRRQVINHLNGGSVEHTTAQTRAGSTAVSRKSQGTVRRKLTLAGAASGRIVPTFGTGDLPGDVAVELGWRKLTNLNSPPRQFSARLPLVAFDLRRGTPVRPHSRSGSMGTYVITSSRLSGNNLGTHRQLVQMDVTGRELK